MRALSRAAPPKELVRAVSRRMSVIRARADIRERRTNVAQNFTKLRRLALKTVRFGCVASTGSLEPDITAEDLADIDLLERVLVDLRGGHLPSVAPGHARDLLLLAIGGSDGSVLGDLEITLALNSCVGLLQ